MKNKKAVLISIRPEWCNLIKNGTKTVEVRKTRPKLETPFKVYIYETKTPLRWNKSHNDIIGGSGGEVIGEFICDNIRYANGTNLLVKEDAEKALRGSCLEKTDLLAYLGVKPFMSRYDKKTEFYCWHISELKIYDKPKELKEFFTLCDMGCEFCEYWTYQRVNADEFDMDCGSRVFGCKEIKRPPQSWRYVEEVEGGVL